MDSGKIVRVMVGGLPLGLALAVVIGIFVYYFEPDSLGKRGGAEETGVSEMARSVPVDEAFVANVYGVFTGALAERGMADREGIRKAGKYLESVLGPQNIGYLVRRPVGVGGNANDWEALELEIKGRSAAADVVMFVVGFDVGEGESLEDSSGRVAVAVAVARALVGDPLERTLRIVIDDRRDEVRENLGAQLAARGERVVAIYELDGPVLGELVVEEGEGYPGVNAVKIRRIVGGSGNPEPVGLVEATKRVEATLRAACRDQR